MLHTQPGRSAPRPDARRRGPTATAVVAVLGVVRPAGRTVVMLTSLAALVACATPRATAHGPGRGDPAPQSVVADRGTRVSPSVNIGDAKTLERLFVGRFPGVAVQSSPSGGFRLRIRGGANSFLLNQEPLYVVDGTPLPPGTGEISFLNPYDIEKIEVLKDASDLSFYGGRGANGVIRITTLRPGRR
jgi:TonB-dependent SusC/RagA subfamily outer membrane receptor